jgi:SDR family mycofactocin-dependent oxidoreductase
MGRLDGATALITGGARGQGRAHGLALAREGANIAILDSVEQIASVPYGMATPDDLAETADAVEALGPSVLPIKADVRAQDQLDAAVAETISRFGRIDFLVANAGVWGRGALHELTEETWVDLMDVNANGVWRTIKAAAPTMMDARDGAIVVTSSINGLEGGSGYAHYVASKHAVLGIMRCAALEYAPFGVRVNAVCPGFIDTKMTDWPGGYEMTTGSPDGTREEHLRAGHYWSALAGRGGISPESVSGAVLWLLSPESKDVTGVALPIDGGHLVLPGFNNQPVFAEDL